MRLLLDTNVFLLSAVDPERLPKTFRDAMDAAEQRYLSVTSAWEIAIKSSIGKISLPEPTDAYIRSRMQRFGLLPLPITLEHALFVESLEFVHRDPFDRLLIAQALVENLTIVTTDRTFDRYPAAVIPET